MTEIKVEPSNKDIEQAIIGMVMFDPPVIDMILTYIRDPNAFYYDSNKYLWTMLLEMYQTKIPIDLLSVTEYSKTHNPYANKLDALHITECFNKASSSGPIKHYAKILQEKFLRRQLNKEIRLLSKRNADEEDTDSLLASIRNISQELENIKPRKDKSINDLIDETLEHIKTSDNIIPFNNKALDTIAGGMSRKEITVIGGRPSMGKSTTVLNIAKGLIEQDLKVMMFNREMNNIEMFKKLLTIETPGMSYTNVRQQTLSDEQAIQLTQTSELMKTKYKNFITYDSIRNLDEAIAEIRRHKPDVIIDDYIQKISMPGNKDRRFQIEDIMNEYSWTIKSINASAILVSQLSREIEKRTDPRPRMSDFSESGTIEQVAETALFVFRGYVFDHFKFNKYQLELIAAKARYGEIGTFPVGFNGNRAKLYNTEQEAMIGK